MRFVIFAGKIIDPIQKLFGLEIEKTQNKKLAKMIKLHLFGRRAMTYMKSYLRNEAFIAS